LEFAGHGWDARAGFAASLPGLDLSGLSDGEVFEAWCAAWAAGALGCLRPGGHLVAFGGARTWHRLVAGVEGAGFEVRDQIAWLYSSGVPKSLDLSNAADRALVVERADREVVVSERDTVLGATRRVVSRGEPVTDEARRWEGWGTGLKPAFEPILVARKPCDGGVVANVLARGTGGLNIARSRTAGGRWPANAALDSAQAARLDALAGSGVAERFPVFHYSAKASQRERPRVSGVSHAAVKPVSLMRWLVDRVRQARSDHHKRTPQQQNPGTANAATRENVGLIDLCSTDYPTAVETENLRLIRASLADMRATVVDTLPDDAQTSRGTPAPRRKWKRLNDDARAQVIARYSAGETTTVLAKDYGVAKSTIIGILRAKNVVVHRQPMTDEQVSEAARLYESGLSLSQVAEALSVNQETMRVAIIKAGVILREPTKAKAPQPD
jgi:site-specific DNA-methyltransferase (adenine-specific)